MDKSIQMVSFLLAAHMAGVGFSGFAQSQVLVNQGEEMLRVIAMDRNDPLVVLDGELSRVFDGQMSVAPADYYTDGSVQVLSKDAAMGPNYATTEDSFIFQFTAQLSADRDFEDCFALFVIVPESGGETFVMREIGDIEVGEDNRVQLHMPVNPGFGGGQYRYLFFSKGEEIEVIDPERDNATLTVTSPAASAQGEGPPDARAPELRDYSGAEAVRAAVEEEFYPSYPAELVGSGVSGLAELVFSIGTDGRATQIIEMAADNAAFLREAQKAVINTRYKPAIFGGVPIESMVSGLFVFGELAQFAEEIQIAEYSDIGDREPDLAYGFIPGIERFRKGKKSTFTIEVTVDPLGRAIASNIVKTTNKELAQTVLESIGDWVFLPAIEGGEVITKSFRKTIAIE